MEHELIGQFPEMAEPIKQAKQTSLLNGYDTSRHALNNELVTPYERGTTESIADGDRELEVIERYSKAKMPMKKFMIHLLQRNMCLDLKNTLDMLLAMLL